MNAIQTALRFYGPSFNRIHGLYSQHGYVISEPDRMLLGRPCVESDYLRWCPKEEADAWWLEWGCGDIFPLIQRIPFELPRIGWAREFKGSPHPRFYDFHRLKSLLNNGLLLIFPHRPGSSSPDSG